MSEGSLPPKCPSCGDRLIVVKLQCSSCGTEVNGEYDMCPVCTLEDDHRELFELFLESRGNLKHVQRRLGVSYPTVRLRMEEMFNKLKGEEPRQEPSEVLQMLSNGEIDVETATRLLAEED